LSRVEGNAKLWELRNGVVRAPELRTRWEMVASRKCKRLWDIVARGVSLKDKVSVGQFDWDLRMCTKCEGILENVQIKKLVSIKKKKKMWRFNN
jgi:hypothetical protein